MVLCRGQRTRWDTSLPNVTTLTSRFNHCHDAEESSSHPPSLPHSQSLPNRIYEAHLSHEDPHLRPLPNRVKSSKAQLSNRDPHPCPCTNTDSHGAHCHTRTLSHDPFIGAKHGAAYARIGARKTGWRTRNNGTARHNREIHRPQDDHRTHTHYTPPTSTKHNQSLPI